MPLRLKPLLLVLLSSLFSQATYATIAKDETPWPSVQSEKQPSARNFGSIPQEKRPLFIFVFVHEDVPESKVPSLFPDFFEPLIKELKSTTGRNVSLRLIRNTPPYTTYAYKNSAQASYEGWRDLGVKYRNDNNLPINRTTKFLLLTNDWMNSETLGVTSPGQQFALATLTSKQVVGHEIGHTLDAQHELAEVRHNGWWCETFMAAKINPLLSNCYVFTDPNRARINEYLKDVP